MVHGPRAAAVLAVDLAKEVPCGGCGEVADTEGGAAVCGLLAGHSGRAGEAWGGRTEKPGRCVGEI